MVTVQVICTKKMIQSIHISGHAYSDNPGSDLVCAGASSIAVGALNALDELFNGDCDLEMSQNDISIQVLKLSETLNVVLKSFLYQFDTMEERFPDNIQVIRKEV